MSVRYDKRNKAYRWEFDRTIEGRRHRLSKLLPRGWSQAEADKFDRQESARLYALATGVARRDPQIAEAVVLYVADKKHLKSYKATMEHLAAIAWAYQDKPMSQLHEVAREVVEKSDNSPATVRNRLACLKAACRWGWKHHNLTEGDPTSRMILPTVRNERHVYIDRKEMLRIARACRNWDAQIAVRVAFYTGMRLGELFRVEVEGAMLHLADTKNGERRSIPAHPKIKASLKHLPLKGKKHTVQVSFEKAAERVGLGHVHFHDLRHSAASQLINSGVELFTVGKVLGHKDARSTARYSHLTAQSLAEAIGKIGRRA
jgi:integrase